MAQNQDYEVPQNILQRYNNQADFSAYTVIQIRGIMHHYNIPYRDANNQILPQFRTSNGNFIRIRRPYIDAVLQHFQQQQPAPNPNPLQPPAPPIIQPQQNQNIQFLSVQALQQILQNMSDKKEQKFERKFHGKQEESVQDFIKYCNTYKELYGKTEDWMYKKILTNGLQNYAATVAHDNRGISFYDLNSLYDWLYLQFYGEQQLELKKKSWEEFQQNPREAIDVAYYRYIALKRDYERAIEFAAQRGANSSLNIAPTEKESFTKFFNGLYKETQLILLTQIETQNKEYKLSSIQQVLRSVKALTVSAHGLKLKYSYDQRSTVNNRNNGNNNSTSRNRKNQNNPNDQNNYGQQQHRNRNYNRQYDNNRYHNQQNYRNQNHHNQQRNNANNYNGNDKSILKKTENATEKRNESKNVTFNPHADKTCYNCGEEGHIATNCTNPKNQAKVEQNKQALAIEKQVQWQYPDHFYMIQHEDYSKQDTLTVNHGHKEDDHEGNCECFTCIQNSFEIELFDENEQLLKTESIEFDVESNDFESIDSETNEINDYSKSKQLTVHTDELPAKHQNLTSVMIITTIITEILSILQFIWLLMKIIYYDLTSNKVAANHKEKEAEITCTNIKKELANYSQSDTTTINYKHLLANGIKNNDFITAETLKMINYEIAIKAIKGENKLIKENQFYKWIKRKSTRYKE